MALTTLLILCENDVDVSIKPLQDVSIKTIQLKLKYWPILI